MTTKINIFGLVLLLTLYSGVGLFFGYLIGYTEARTKYTGWYKSLDKSTDSLAIAVDSFRMKQDTLEALINTKCNENIKNQIDSIKKKRASEVVQNKSLPNLSGGQLWKVPCRVF